MSFNKRVACGPGDPAGWDSYCKGDKRTLLHPQWTLRNRGRSRFRTDANGRRAGAGLLQVVSRHIRIDQSGECCGAENAFVMGAQRRRLYSAAAASLENFQCPLLLMRTISSGPELLFPEGAASPATRLGTADGDDAQASVPMWSHMVSSPGRQGAIEWRTKGLRPSSTQRCHNLRTPFVPGWGGRGRRMERYGVGKSKNARQAEREGLHATRWP